MIEIHVRESCDCENGMRPTELWEKFHARYLAEPRATREEMANNWWREHGSDWTIPDTLPEEERPCEKCGGRATVERWVPCPAELADLLRAVT